MLILLPAFLLRAMTRAAFRTARKLHKAATYAERLEATAGGYYLHPAAFGAALVVLLVLTALVEGA